MSCKQEEKEREEHLYEPPSPSIISERGPQTPSMFPLPSPYLSTEHSLELAAPTFLAPESLEMLPPREDQAWVCFGHNCCTYIFTYILDMQLLYIYYVLSSVSLSYCTYTTYTVPNGPCRFPHRLVSSLPMCPVGQDHLSLSLLPSNNLY